MRSWLTGLFQCIIFDCVSLFVSALLIYSAPVRSCLSRNFDGGNAINPRFLVHHATLVSVCLRLNPRVCGKPMVWSLRGECPTKVRAGTESFAHYTRLRSPVVKPSIACFSRADASADCKIHLRCYCPVLYNLDVYRRSCSGSSARVRRQTARRNQGCLAQSLGFRWRS